MHDDMNCKVKYYGCKPEIMLSFHNIHNNETQLTIWDELRAGLWKDFSIDNHIYNNLIPAQKLEQSKPLFPNFHQIVPGTIWDKRNNCLKQELYRPQKVACKLTDLIDAAQKYFDSLKANRIGVHLSGGFDSSLIMAILKELKIPFVPIGLRSETFEFRTECHIQDIVLQWGENGHLIDIEEYPHYSGLDIIPAHQIPDSDIKSVTGAKAMAKAFRERNCDVVLSGLGGDNLFVDEISSIDNLCFNIGNEFLNVTEKQRVYEVQGIRLESFFAQPDIINVICSAREGQKQDFLKLWARKWAKNILPVELTEKAFCADFFGLSMYGLEIAKPMIKTLMGEAFEITDNHYFSPDNVSKFLNQDVFSFEYSDYIKFCSLVSVASWYHSLFNNA